MCVCVCVFYSCFVQCSNKCILYVAWVLVCIHCYTQALIYAYMTYAMPDMMLVAYCIKVNV